MFIKNEDFDNASKLFHFPDHYSKSELIDDRNSISETLKFFNYEFGKVLNEDIFYGSDSFYEVGIAGGNLEYWKNHSHFVKLNYRVEFEKEGEGYIGIFFCNISGFWQIRQVAYGLPFSRPDSKTRIMNIMDKMIERSKNRQKKKKLSI